MQAHLSVVIWKWELEKERQSDVEGPLLEDSSRRKTSPLRKDASSPLAVVVSLANRSPRFARM
ncbi:hypothetical protein AGABI2DRAFT_182825, partial [Agaricus bisporus var. bisporus H97]|uniref:hypothetical protein n=1 Tax=Agaricus bisporus var. bisporus (strain H97 / ATCC MYA-4626 / FGSC 10389) TaxID=936046 RepID=UPI00029F6957